METIFTPTRMDKIKNKTAHNKCRWRYGETGTSCIAGMIAKPFSSVTGSLGVWRALRSK
jgi:hypothetical protein